MADPKIPMNQRPLDEWRPPKLVFQKGTCRVCKRVIVLKDGPIWEKSFLLKIHKPVGGFDDCPGSETKDWD